MTNTILDQERNISDIIDNEYKSYAMYVLESRAIPSYIDGMKPVHRKLLYSMINNYKGKKIKLNELGSSIASVAAYHHGESSAQGAAVTLTADWNNNIPVFRGYGNFGTRLIQESAAPRYIFADLSQEFYKYFTDFNVCTAHKDVDNPEPQQYLPVIPWVLVNGIEGIAVGFACRYLPHNPKDIAKACIKAVKGKLKDDYVLPVSFPGFKGEVTQDNITKVTTRGIIDRVKRNNWLISEVPWGYDREKIFVTLDKMVEQGKIQDFEDQCDDSGFKFLVKMDNTQDGKCALNPIEYFKLEKSFTENYTALDESGNIVLFDNKVQIIKRFVEFRISKVKQRIQYDIDKIDNEISWFTNKQRFVSDVVTRTIDLLQYKRSDLVDFCMNEYSVEKEIASRLISTPVYDMTSDMIEDLHNKINQLKDERSKLSNSDPSDVYLEMLSKII